MHMLFGLQLRQRMCAFVFNVIQNFFFSLAISVCNRWPSDLKTLPWGVSFESCFSWLLAVSTISSCDNHTVCFKLILIEYSDRCIPDVCKFFLQHQGFSIVGEWLDNTHIDLNVKTLTMFYYFYFWFCCLLTIFYS